MSDSICEVILRYLGWVLDGIGFRMPSSPIADAVSLSTTDYATLISGFGGALLGAVIGAAVSYLTARQSATDARRRDAEAREEIEKSAALKTMFKAIHLANSVEMMVGHITKGMRRELGDAMPIERLWTFVQPTAPANRAPVEFDASDFVFLLKKNYGDLMNRALMLANRVAALEAAFDAYGRLRVNMQELLEDHTRVDDRLGASVTEVPPEISNKANLRSLEMDNLLKSILADSYEYKDDATQVCFDLNEAAKAVFGGTFPITLDTVQRREDIDPIPR